MGLAEDIVEKSREIQTDGYSMSIGEMVSLYRDGDLDVHPEFQRIFRWEDSQKWRLVESILLGIPIPTIFVAQRSDGIWDVIDGVQRLSTVLEFVGAYKDEDGDEQDPLVLGPTEYLPALAGHVWGEPADGQEDFGEALRRDFKRSKLDFRIIKKESDDDAKFDLFQRLNSGTQLSPQESRNCLLVMLNADFYRWMSTLAEHESFLETALLSQRKEDEGFKQELVLRFTMQLEYTGKPKDLPMELSEYITAWSRRAAQTNEQTLDDWQDRFSRVFDLLLEAVGEDVFRRWDSSKQRFSGAFSISSFEAVTSGVAHNLEAWETAPPTELADKVHAMWAAPGFKNNSGTGVSGRRRMPRLVDFGRKHFKP